MCPQLICLLSLIWNLKMKLHQTSGKLLKEQKTHSIIRSQFEFKIQINEFKSFHFSLKYVFTKISFRALYFDSFENVRILICMKFQLKKLKLYGICLIQTHLIAINYFTIAWFIIRSVFCVLLGTSFFQLIHSTSKRKDFSPSFISLANMICIFVIY